MLHVTAEAMSVMATEERRNLRSRDQSSSSFSRPWLRLSWLQNSLNCDVRIRLGRTIDAPYAPGNRGLWREAKALNRQEFVIVGWSTLRARGRILGRCCLATTRTTASSPTPAGWAQGCPTRCLPIYGGVLSRSPARQCPLTYCRLARPGSPRRWSFPA